MFPKYRVNRAKTITDTAVSYDLSIIINIKGCVFLDNTVKISVRNLVEFVSRSGDINTLYTSMNRNKEGIRLHKLVQSIRKKKARLEGSSYESEYSLKHSFVYKDCSFTVEGRADGIYKKDENIWIEEIKSTFSDLDFIEFDSGHWHMAQAKCYGYMYAFMNALNGINIMLTYVHGETEELKVFEHSFSFKELEDFFYGIIEGYYLFAQLDKDRINLRNETAFSMTFPFEKYRKGQRELSISVYAAAKNKKNLFAVAPTGTGKTMSVLYPSVKALEQGISSKIFYITSRGTNSLAAVNGLEILEEKGLKMRSISLTAKEKICFMEKCLCNPKDCPYAKGHFDRINDAILDIVENSFIITPARLRVYAEKHKVCPFEYQLDVSLFTDTIIGDYNYVYDPTARLKRFFGEGAQNDYIVLADEAHNLLDRGREMFSAELFTKELEEARKSVKIRRSRFKSVAGRLIEALKEKSSICETDGIGIIKELESDFYYLLKSLVAEGDKLLASGIEGEAKEKITDLYFKLLDFIRVLDNYNDGYSTLIIKEGKHTGIKLFCIDPSYQFSALNKNAGVAVFFSATLMPLDFYKDVLGGQKEDYNIILESPFPPENFQIIINDAISTKYKDRERTYQAVSDALAAAVSARRGKYMAFFSSYAYMEEVYGIFKEDYPYVNTIIQVRGEKGEEFLKPFKDQEEDIVGFAVLGAGYSEGIDLAGDMLIGVIVVGVGLPQLSPERNIIRDYYSVKNGMGYEYAYMYPGMNKVLQASGRVIRQETDKGIAMLIDSRYGDRRYQALFPRNYRGFKRAFGKVHTENILNTFWNTEELGKR